MAKAGFWLRGAKGKLAGAVAQKGEKGTVLRENVVPHNPRSDEQMFQRIAFGTAASAAKFMLPIIGQSFYGTLNETLNRRAFLQENVYRLKNEYKDGEGSALPKNVSQLVSNDYVISNGSLNQRWEAKYDETFNAFYFAVDGNPAPENDLRKNVLQITADWYLEYCLGIKPGQQLTFAFIYYHNYFVWHSPEALGDHPHVNASSFEARRIVAKANPEPINVTAQMTDAQIKAQIKYSIFDMSKSDEKLVDWILSGQQWEVDTTTTPNALVCLVQAFSFVYFNTDEKELDACAIFVSELIDGEWDYSRAVMREHMSDLEPGADYLSAYGTHFGHTAVSGKFTQQGGTADVIG